MDLGTTVLQADVLSQEALIGAIVAVLRFFLAFSVIWLVGQKVGVPFIERALKKRELEAHVRSPLLKLVNFGILFIGVAVAFGFAGYGNFLVSLAGITAAGALAVGLALQNVISNFVAGVFIYMDKSFRVDDWIEWDNGTYSGTVEDISLRVTHVRTFDNELLTVPNSALTEGVIKNPVDGDKLRLKFVFGIGYDDDIQEATDIIIEEAERNPEIMDDPAPSVRLTELNDSDVGLQSRIWIANPSRADFVRTKGEYITSVKQRFDEEGIDIPYPVRTLEGGLELANQQAILKADD